MTGPTQHVAVDEDDICRVLRRAYRVEAQEGYDTENVFARLLSGRGERFGVLGIREERIIENAYLMRSIKNLLRIDDRNLLDCYYTCSFNPRLKAHKEGHCARVGEELRNRLTFRADKWFVVDVVRHWANLRRKHNCAWWADHLDMEKRQLERWQYGWRDHKGIIRTLDEWLEGVHDRLSASLYSIN